MAGQAFANFIARRELPVDLLDPRLALAAVADHCVDIVKMRMLERLIPNQAVLALTAST